MNDHVASAEDIDGVAVLTGAAKARRNVLDTVLDHHGAVIARIRAPDQDPVVAGPADGVAGNHEATCVEREDSGRRGARDGVVRDLALD